MKFYQISSRYISYLKEFEEKVPNSEDPTYQNPKAFIGIFSTACAFPYLKYGY